MNLMKKFIEEDVEDGKWTTRVNHLYIPLYKGKTKK